MKLIKALEFPPGTLLYIKEAEHNILMIIYANGRKELLSLQHGYVIKGIKNKLQLVKFPVTLENK